ncbi:MAG: SRPBCC domain-containing protein [Acidimicrobiales bacterium]
METVERTVSLPTDLEGAWELLTHPDELAAWLGDDVTLRPVPGAPGRVLERDGTDRALVVEEVDEGRRLSWRWWVDGDDPDQTGSRVEITLSPTPDGTLVRVVEQPLLTATASTPRASAGEAWSHRLLHLESLLLVAAAIRG